MSRFALPILSGLALGLFAWSSAPAHAALGDECAADADCGEGLVCQVVGGTACACPNGQECPECVPTELKACVPGPCATDADCGEGLVCVTYEVPCASTAIDCAPGSECPEPTPSDCTPTSESVCAPRWVLPCEAAADCGAGFTCEAYEICECSGGGGTPTDPSTPSEPGGGSSGSGGGESPGVPRDGDSGCTCTPSEDLACRPTATTCQGDSECPDGWTCAQASVTDTPCPSGESCEPTPSEPGPGTCQPAGWEVGISRSEDYGAPTAANDSAEIVPPGTPGTAAGGGCVGGSSSALAGLALGLAAVLGRRKTA